MEFFSLTGDEGPIAKLDCLFSNKSSFQLRHGRVLTGLRGGPILSLPLLY